MSTGIYCLTFNNTDKVYIGQARNLLRRKHEHLRDLKSGNASKKLLEAYKMFGEPEFFVLEICSEADLNSLELVYINEFDSVNNGFNTLDYHGNPNISGHTSIHAKLTKELYIEIYRLLATTDLTVADIADSLDVSYDVVANISLGRTHSWLKEEYPEYAELMRIKGKVGRYHTNSISRKVVSPSGEVYQIETTIAEFCRQHNLSTMFSRLLNGTRKSYKKWTLFKE